MSSSNAAPEAAAQRWALALLILGGVTIGFAPILARLSETGLIAAAAWRLTLAVPAMALLPRRANAAGPRLSLRQASPRIRRLLVFSGMCFAGDVSCFHSALALTSVANATLLVNLAPVFVGLAAWLFWRQRPDRAFLLGLAAALLGGWALSAGAAHPAAGSDPGRGLQGDLLSLLAALFYAGYLVALKEVAAVLSFRTVMIVGCSITAVLLWIAAALLGDVLLPHSLWGWTVVLLLGIVVHAGGQGAITAALASLPVGFSSLVLLLQGVVAAIAAWMLFDQPMTALQMLGAAGIVFGIVLARRTRSR